MPNPTKIDALPTENDPRWQAVLARDPAADGRFSIRLKPRAFIADPLVRHAPPNRYMCSLIVVEMKLKRLDSAPVDAVNRINLPCANSMPLKSPKSVACWKQRKPSPASPSWPLSPD